MIDIDDTYRRLARSWTHEQLTSRYRDAERRGAGTPDIHRDDLTWPIALVAAAIPPSATLSVAVHLLHVLPKGADIGVPEDLATTAEKNAANALHRCHRALELDGQAHGYTVDEWLPTVYEIAAQLLESAHPNGEPPTVVQAAQDAISWLSQVVVDLHQDSAEIPSALAEALGRLLAASIFAAEVGGNEGPAS